MTSTDAKRIHFTYRHVDRPWGGANNFTRALAAHLSEKGEWVLTGSPTDTVDIMFMNQLGLGPGSDKRRLRISEVTKMKVLDQRKVVVRAVNLYRHAFRLGPRNLIYGALEDIATLRLLGLADQVIFQSEYQRSVFQKAGYRGVNHVVIHNGASELFWNQAPPVAPTGPLRIVSATASPRQTKRHDVILAISLLPDVEVMHFGAWPKGLNSGNVRLMGTCDGATMARHYAQAHMMLHPAIKDPCPNAIFEAVCSGLPVLYNPDIGSSAEIVGENGVALDLADLVGSVATARTMLADLQERVRQNREYYHIGRATRAYADTFRAVAEA
ncbi:glycosyltransferase [uncultured Devosia sp.]|uniref:glycosyltransferase n=1 Tax=uncultured Devosia sp. TaxID=211434 RepID=UPI002606E22A|nr:glycosyltransferase [uncultured Devosia sp.]